MKLVPLSRENIDSMQQLINETFPTQTFLEKVSLRACIGRKNPFYRLILAAYGIKKLEYWIGFDKDGESIMGTVGLYTKYKDCKEANWLGWYCVSPTHRGKGIGSRLLDFAVEKTKEKGKAYLRLYTETFPEEAHAQKVYEAKGFKIIRQKKIPGTEHDRIYRELKL